jgi:hypothetical protein
MQKSMASMNLRISEKSLGVKMPTGFNSRLLKIGVKLAVLLLVPNLLLSEIVTFEYDNTKYKVDTTEAFCKFNKHQQESFEHNQRMLKAAGQRESIFGQFACKSFGMFPYSNIGLRWQGRIPVNLPTAGVKKALEKNFTEQLGKLTILESVAEETKALLQSTKTKINITKVLETSSNHTFLYTVFTQPLANSDQNLTMESFSSYIYSRETGNIFILTLATPKTKNKNELEALVDLISEISDSLSKLH